MKKAQFYVALVSLALFIMFMECSVFSMSFEGKKYDVGVSLGPWFSGGDVNIDNDPVNYDLTKKTCFLIKGYADAYAVPAFALGIYAHFAPSVTYEESDSKQSMYEFGFSIKVRYILNDKLAFKPGLGIGYRRFSSNDDLADKYKALGINLSFELQYAVSDSMMIYIEPGFLGQPKGDNGTYTMDFAPIWYLMAGVAF